MSGNDGSLARRDFLKMTAIATVAPLAGCAAKTPAGSGPSGSEPQASTSSASASGAVVASSVPYDGYFASHEPIGVGKGLHPGRVSWAYGPKSVLWDGEGHWWVSHFNEAAARDLVDSALMTLAGEGDPKASWNARSAIGSPTAVSGRKGAARPVSRGRAPADMAI